MGLLITLIPKVGFAQGPKLFKAPLAGKVVTTDINDKYSTEIYSLEMPETDDTVEQRKLRAVKQLSSQLYPRHSSGIIEAKKGTSTAMPRIGYNYVADSLPGIPPYNDLAMGNGKTISVMNLTIAMHDAPTGTLTFRSTLINFSASAGLGNATTNSRYDPKIMYDPVADRFICVMLNNTDSTNYIFIGFSSTNKPDSTTWNFYKFYGDYASDTTWFDFPSVALTQKEFFFTGNKILYSTPWQTGFRKSVIYQIRKADGYNGDSTLTYQIWDSVKYAGNYVRNLYPVKGGASIKGPDQYFLSDKNFDIQNDTFYLIRIPDTIGSSSKTLTVKALASNVRYGVPPDARQSDTAYTLATNDGRILGAFEEGNEIQFVSATVDTSSGGAAVYHGIISNYSTATPVVRGKIFGIDTLDFGYPNLSYTGTTGSTNQAIISFNYTGPHTYPGLGAVYYDGTGYSDLLSVKGGLNSIRSQPSQKQQRWGDYSGSQPEWSTLGCVWVDGIYGRTDRRYGNYIARLISPDFTGVTNPTRAAANSGVLYPNPSWQFVQFDFKLEMDELMQFMIYDINGRMVDNILSQNCKEGENVIRFNVASLSPGTYYLKGLTSTGKALFSNKFIRK